MEGKVVNIKYLSYYAQPNNNQDRNYVLSAKTKMDYIVSIFNKYGYDVRIISASPTRNSQKGFHGGLFKINEKTTLKMFYTFPWGNKIQKLLSVISMNLFLFFELMKTNRNEKILVYHSLGYMTVVDIVHRIKGFHLVLEVEEIYSDVIGNPKQRNKEIEFIRKADSYIFPTKLLSKEVNKAGRPEIIIHGTYNVEPDYNCKFNDGKIHVVYAGTFDPRKGGAVAAAAAAEFLDERYHIHIIGFGSEKEVKHIKDVIDNVSKNTSCTITYDGLKSGEEYIRFIQSCDIGLSTQNPDAAFNGTSFPSKILSYMSNGLRVVSILIPAIEQSAVGKYLYYYNKQTPMEIAKAIMSVRTDDEYNSRNIISKLSKEFENNLIKLFS